MTCERTQCGPGRMSRRRFLQNATAAAAGVAVGGCAVRDIDADVMVAVPGDGSLEAKLHTRFAGCRKHGEWFEPSDELLDLIAELQEHAQTDEGVG